ncbi:hypothetical protein LJC08_04730 [Methanimicrococcus sp. OttesenSCG-928-J09]|nr:hypothetical protein [Methanimicrococcus sp. OttesenSCG-928-J09]
MVDTNLITNLKKFGLSENEAKAYIGLVFLKEPSVRELHDFTNIPRAKLYEVLDNLVTKRYAEILHGIPVHYKPTEPEDMIQMLREDYEKTADDISRAFEEMDMQIFDDDPDEFVSIQYLRSEWTVRKKLNELLDETDKNLIILSRSSEILSDIESELVSVKKRVNILILVNESEDYGDFSLPLTIYPENVRPILKELEESHIVNQSCVIFSDSGKAMAIRLDETKMEAHYISQSIVEFMYKTIYYFVYSAEDVHLPEELLKEPAARKTPSACKSNVKSCEAHSGCGRRSVKNKLKQATENLKKPNK